MRRRRKLARFADFAIPWGVGLFLVLVVFARLAPDASARTVGLA